MSPAEIGLVLGLAAAAFLVSSSVGLGGSLLLVPGLVLVLGTKPGIALAALLLAANNVAKVVAYRRTVPWRAVAAVLALTLVGGLAGALLLTAAPDRTVDVAVIGVLVASGLCELCRLDLPRGVRPPGLALLGGLTSGFSGTSGPLKGVALRALALDRAHLVGAAAWVSLAADVAKTTVFASAALLPPDAVTLTVLAAPLMIAATAAGRQLNRIAGERCYAVMFWSVIAGYIARLAF